MALRVASGAVRLCRGVFGQSRRMVSDWTGIPQVAPAEALQAVETGRGSIVDVREGDEVALDALATDFVACPMSELHGRVATAADKAEALRSVGITDAMGTSDDTAIYCLCKAGVRGQNMAEFFKQCGKTHVANVTGGIMACDRDDRTLS